MTATNSQRIVQHLRRWAGEREPSLSDGELLGRYRTGRDQSAFAELVRRHGAMVFAVCRSVLRRHDDAEDAFQAAFLVLTRRAGAIREPDALSSWLHGVAYRVALKARAERTRRQMREADAAPRQVSEFACDDLSWGELRALLHAELAALPERFRAPLVLCYLEGLTQDEAAQRLSCTAATVKGRLQRGREKLRRRLERRGVALTAALAAALTGQTLGTTVPEALTETAVRAAGQPSAAATLLAGSFLRPVVSVKMLVLTTALVSVGLVAAGVGMLAPRPEGDEPAATAAPNPDDPRPGPRTDLYGDPLPAGAIVRMGSVRLRHAGLSDFVILPDGKTILSTGGSVVRYWDMATGKQVREVRLPGAAGPVHGAAPSADGKLLATLQNNQLVVWEIESGQQLKTLPVPKENWAHFYFSPDAATLIFGTWKPEVILWDWKNRKDRHFAVPRKIGLDSTYHSCVSPDGKWFAAGGGAGCPLYVFDFATGKEVHRLLCDASASTFSPDSKRLIVAGMYNDQKARQAVIRIFDLASGKETAQHLLGKESSYFTLTFSPDGKTLACGSSDQSCLLDIATGRVIHRLADRPINMAFSPDGKTLVAKMGYRFRLVDPATGKILRDPPGNFGTSLAMTVSPDSKLLAEADWLDRAVSVWETGSGRLLRQLRLKGETRYVRNVAFSADGKTLVACQFKGFLQFWDVATGKETRTVQLVDSNWTNPDLIYFYQLHVSSDGKRLSTLERDILHGDSTRLAYWDLDTGKLLRQHSLPPSTRECAWSADGETVALPLKDGLKWMQVESGGARFHVAGTSNGGPVVLSPDERLLAAIRPAPAKGEFNVGIWETATGKEVASIATGRVFHLALAPDNRHLVATDAKSLRMWDLATGRETYAVALPEGATLSWMGHAVTAALLSLDGRRAVTALGDGTALVWDLTPALQRGDPLVKNPSEREATPGWNDLASEDARRAYAAIWRLSEAQSVGVTLLRRHLKPAGADEVNVLRRLIADLDHDDFATRERAFEQLNRSGDAAESILRRALTKTPTLEARRRIQLLLERLSERPASGESLRVLRALTVLEQSGAEGRRLLRELAAGADDAWMTGQARAALARCAP